MTEDEERELRKEMDRLIAENESLRSQLQVAKSSISDAVHSLVDIADRLGRAMEVRS